MANMPNNKSAYQGKTLSPVPTQGLATNQRAGKGDPKLLPHNEPSLKSRTIDPRHPNQLQNPNRGGTAK